MKFTVLRDKLLPALTLAATAARNKSLPILRNVYLETSDGTILFAATDLDVAYEAHVPGRIEAPGKITVNAKDLLATIKAAPKGAIVEISVDEKEHVLIESGPLSRTLSGISTNEYPVLASAREVGNKASFRLNSSDLRDALLQVIPAVANDEGRPILTGMLFEFLDGQVRLVAADNYRLSTATIDLLPGSGTHEQPLVIPGTSLALLIKTLPKIADAITVTYSRLANLVWFERDGVLVGSRMIDGHFPNYQQIVPTSSSTWITVDKESLSAVAKAADKASANHTVNVSLSDEGVRIDAIDENEGQFRATVKSRALRGDEIRIAFNPRYLTDVNALPGDELALGLNGPLSPAIFRSDEGPYMVLMPVRISG